MPQPRRKCVFNADLQKSYPYMKKGSTDSDVFCEICNSTMNISADGRNGIEKHIKTTKHEKALNARSKSRTVNEYFPSSADYTISAYEGLWTYHVIKSNNSFKSSDCASKIFRMCFAMTKFYCARTKSHAITKNVFAPFVVGEIKKELHATNYITITTDASNRGSVKLFPILARYFIPTVGVQVKILELSSEKGETSAIIANLLKKNADDFEIKDKIVGFCADNCPTNFGSMERGGENKVYYHLKHR